MNNRIQIIFISSNSRSGSTILERTLGQLPNFCSVGEVHNLWNRGILDEQLCGCGKPLPYCDFWRNVLELAFNSKNLKDYAKEINNLAVLVTRYRYMFIKHLPNWMRGKSYPHIQTQSYINILADLYNAIAKITENQIIIDSSKLARYASLISEIPNTDIHIIHLVRDSRAVVFSHQRKKLRPEITDRRVFMDIVPWQSVCYDWSVNNLSTTFLKSPNIMSRTFLRYEDFVNDPITSLKIITENLNVENLNLDTLFTKEKKIFLKKNHTISGNPSRFQVGEILLDPDFEWTRIMSKELKTKVTIATFPFLFKYKYL